MDGQDEETVLGDTEERKKKRKRENRQSVCPIALRSGCPCPINQSANAILQEKKAYTCIIVIVVPHVNGGRCLI